MASKQLSRSEAWRRRASTRLARPMAHLKRRLGLVKPAVSSGMGAVANGRGTAFRVWAPHANNVSVAGTFNNWSLWRTPLAQEDNGHWSITVRNAKPGDQYKYVIDNDTCTDCDACTPVCPVEAIKVEE